MPCHRPVRVGDAGASGRAAAPRGLFREAHVFLATPGWVAADTRRVTGKFPASGVAPALPLALTASPPMPPSSSLPPPRRRPRARAALPSEGRRIEVRGTVQGVGFRPWVYRLAAAARRDRPRAQRRPRRDHRGVRPSRGARVVHGGDRGAGAVQPPASIGSTPPPSRSRPPTTSRSSRAWPARIATSRFLPISRPAPTASPSSTTRTTAATATPSPTARTAARGSPSRSTSPTTASRRRWRRSRCARRAGRSTSRSRTGGSTHSRTPVRRAGRGWSPCCRATRCSGWPTRSRPPPR